MRRLAIVLVLILPAGALFAQAPAADPLGDILKNLDADSPEIRAAAGPELDRWCHDAGGKATEQLAARKNGASVELAGRIAEQISFLEQLGQARKAAEMFNAFELAPVAGKKFVRFNTGGGMRAGDMGIVFQYATGWVESETDGEIRIADDSLATGTWKTNVPLPKDWKDLKGMHPKGEPLPGKYKVIEFQDACQEVLEPKGSDEDAMRQAIAGMVNSRRGALGGPLTALLYAKWADERGLDRAAVALHRKALKSAEEERRGEDKRGGDEILAGAVAARLRWSAIRGANGGMPRAELLKGWRAIAAIPANSLTEEAKILAAAYERQVTEDAEVKEPAAEALAAMAPAERAEVWIRRLRDVAATQWSQPGECRVLDWSPESKDATSAAEELRKLGTDAIPALIAHMDDPQPTRSMGFWRDFAPDSYYLLRFGDACQQIFDAITGVRVYERPSTSGYPMRDGKGAETKKAAAAWWEANKGKDPADRELALLDTNPDKAAGELLRIDKAKYLPLLVERVKTNKKDRFALLQAISSDLGKEHAEFLGGLLEDPNNSVVYLAAHVLWYKCADEKGAQLLARRVAAAEHVDRFNDSYWIDGTIRLLANIPKDFAEEALAGLISSSDKSVRLSAIRWAEEGPSRRVAEALLAQFKDDDETGSFSSNAKGASVRPRYCDEAAKTLATLLARPEDFDYWASDLKRDKAIKKLAEWWDDNREKVDWAALRSKGR